MNLRRLLFGLFIVLSLWAWSWCRPASKTAQAQTTADPVYEAAPDSVGDGANHEDASYRFRSNQSMHWRQVTMGCRGTCP